MNGQVLVARDDKGRSGWTARVGYYSPTTGRLVRIDHIRLDGPTLEASIADAERRFPDRTVVVA